MLAAKLLSVRPTAAATASITYNAYSNFTLPTGMTFTATAFNIGAAATGRIVAVYMGGGVGTSLTVSAVTIGGISATQATGFSGFRFGYIWYAVVATGTTANIVVTYTNQSTPSDIAISTASIYGAVSTTPVAGVSNNTSTGVTSSLSVTLTPAANSVLFAGYNAGGIAAGTASTWTNATKQTDTLGTISTTSLYTDATATGLPNASRTITCVTTDAAVNRPGLVVATWA